MKTLLQMHLPVRTDNKVRFLNIPFCLKSKKFHGNLHLKNKCYEKFRVTVNRQYFYKMYCFFFQKG